MFPEAKTPADVTPAMANEYKSRRAEAEVSPWSIKGDLATLKAVFGKWLGRELWFADFQPIRQRETAEMRRSRCADRVGGRIESTFQLVWGSLEQLATATCLFGGGSSLGLASHGNRPVSGRKTCLRMDSCGWPQRIARPGGTSTGGFHLTCTPICKPVRPVVGLLVDSRMNCADCSCYGSGDPTTQAW